ncbi:MAG: carbohydrate-binding domain-containing protein [Clostridia bacterium]|nr:carbohydrate-binding domain-containing protein [Clostridia bacterium]
MKKLIALLISLLTLVFLVACGDEETPIDTSSKQEGTNSGEALQPDEDLVTIPSNYDVPEILELLGSKLDVFDAKDKFEVGGEALGYEGVTDVDVSEITLKGKYEIKYGGAYRFYGKSENAQIYVKPENKGTEDVVILLDNVDLTFGAGAPTIYAEDCKSVTIILVDGSENYLSDASNNDGEKGVIRVRSCDLTLDGKGKLTIDAKEKYAISNTKKLTIKGGEYDITSVEHGIYGNEGLTVKAGKYTMDVQKSAFKSGNDHANEKDEQPEPGYIVINECSAKLKCGTNGFNCFGPVTIDNGYFKIEAKDGNGIDATENVEIKNGTFIINSAKSAIKSEKDVSISGEANVKIETTGNGISGNNVTVSTKGIIYIQTSALYLRITRFDNFAYVKISGEYKVYDAKNTEHANEDVYIKIADDEYVKAYIKAEDAYVNYRPDVHTQKDPVLYERRDCKGIKSDNKLTITNVTLGINSYEDALKATTVAISSGEIIVNTMIDGIDTDSVTISGTANFRVVYSQKGINAKTVKIENGKVDIVADKDAINGKNITITNGIVYLYDKFDTGENGTVTVNGGKVIMLSTTKKPQATSGSAKYISGVIENKAQCVAGAYMRITNGKDIIEFKLPKDYLEKAALYITTNESSVTVEIGVYENGEFKPAKTETLSK